MMFILPFTPSKESGFHVMKKRRDIHGDSMALDLFMLRVLRAFARLCFTIRIARYSFFKESIQVFRYRLRIRCEKQGCLSYVH